MQFERLALAAVQKADCREAEWKRAALLGGCYSRPVERWWCETQLDSRGILKEGLARFSDRSLWSMKIERNEFSILSD